MLAEGLTRRCSRMAAAPAKVNKYAMPTGALRRREMLHNVRILGPPYREVG